jgi:hypothetical protein
LHCHQLRFLIIDLPLLGENPLALRAKLCSPF